MDSAASTYEKLLTQCKSNDVDAKVDALAKLQTIFEQDGIEVPDTEALIGTLKTSLRTSNLHLTNATLSALPAILPALISHPSATHSSGLTSAPSASTSSVSQVNLDIPTLRLALSSFLTAGGIIDRLGDKERAQAKARESLVILGGYAFRGSSATAALAAKAGKGQEPPIAVFERFIKEGGLASKVWKVREQSILTLVHIRRAHHLFPIRPYSALLVDCLEDTDPHVRDCARTSVVELFTGPGVTDAARADLKKEMTKKNVRKTIVDGVLGKLLTTPMGSNSQSREGSENGDAIATKKEYIPPSLALQGKRPRVASQNTTGSNTPGMTRTVSQPTTMSRPASRAAMVSPPPQTPTTADTPDIRPVYIASGKDLENEFAAMAKPFEGKETEHNWALRDQSIQRVRGMLKGEAHIRFPEPFFLGLKEGFIQWSLKTLASLRTTVAVNTCLLYCELAQVLGPQLDTHVEALVANLLKMAGFTKKITAQQSQATISTIITNTSAQPRIIIPLLWNASQDKIVQARAYVVGHIKLYLEHHGHRSKHSIEASNHVETLEKALKRALADSNPAAREQARILFWVFEDIWPDRGTAILETLELVARKQVEKACPSPNSQSVLPPTTPQISKKSSVAAAIAASRAKAKVIATAPPTLRHQATSSSHAGAPRRAGSQSPSSKAPMVVRPNSPLRSTTAPPSPRRVSSASSARTTSMGNVHLVSHRRTPSDASVKAERPTSPAGSNQDTTRRQSSPLTGTGSTMRKALAIALPPSPPSQATPTPSHRPRNGAVPLPPRQSLSQVFNMADDSLLMAQTVPIPDDTDSEDDVSMNLMSFSAPQAVYSETKLSPLSDGTASPVSDSRPAASISNALSSGSISDMAESQQFVVEDALRARAEQAESAAERLLELVEPEEVTQHRSAIPESLTKTTNGHGEATPKAEVKPVPILASRPKAVPVTPDSRASKIMKQAAMFMDSPAPNRNGRPANLLDVLQSQPPQTGWWLKRNTLHAQASYKSDATNARKALEELINVLDNGDADIAALKRLILISIENAASEPSSHSVSTGGKHPSSPTPADSRSTSLLNTSIWEKDKSFDRFFKALMKYLEPARGEEELLYGLILAWEILENQTAYLDGTEGELFSVILQVRYCNKINVLEGTCAIRDALTSKVDPVYGLTTLHSSLKLFQAQAPPLVENADIKAASYAFGLMALGRFILRLPAEIAEEELPRLKATLITALNDKSSLIVRESAAAAIIAAQFVLRDETHLFTLLDGLADEKKNLLTYLFDKHGARGAIERGATGIDKLEKEIRRLDTRTSTPMRGGI